MKKILKALLYLILFIAILAAAALSYIYFFLPKVGKAPDITIKKTSERIERGRYLANHVTVCIDCHSTRDWSLFAGPIINGTEGSGGETFDHRFGFPGSFYSRNITPYKIASWSDGEIFRLITTGVNKNGKAMFPIMPYKYYGQLDKEDIYSIIAYIRTLPEIKKDIPSSKPDFPFSLIINTIPQKANLHAKPLESDTINYGKYLVTASACVECHTQVKNGQIIAGLEFSGGREFAMPSGIIRSANITPDKTGIGEWTSEQFVKRFTMYQDTSYHPQKLKENDFNSVMPWMMYSGMKKSDLLAIYTYLKTVKPITNRVIKFTPKS